MNQELILNVKPEQLVGDRNIRFSLLPTRIESMAESILDRGGIETPLIVEPTEVPDQYRIKDGHYRNAAALKLNKEQNAGLLVPVIVRESADAIGTIKSQLVANLERQDMTPMDKAVVMRQLMAAGMPRIDIRNLFRTSGGRKGRRNQPLSNASLNMTMSFLDLPKPIQMKIHDGTVGVAAAYELVKVTPEKRQAVLDRAEKEYLDSIAREAKDEEKFLAEQKKEEEAQAKRKETEAALERSTAALAEAEAILKAKVDAASEAYRASKGGAKDDEEKAATAKALKAAEEEARDAEKKKETIRKELERLAEKVKLVEKNAAERAKRLAEARKTAQKGKQDNSAKKGATPAGVRKAAKELGAAPAGSFVPLKIADINRAVAEWNLPGGNPKAEAIFALIKRCFDGDLTPGQTFSQVLVITGEKVAPKPPVIQPPVQPPTAAQPPAPPAPAPAPAPETKPAPAKGPIKPPAAKQAKGGK